MDKKQLLEAILAELKEINASQKRMETEMKSFKEETPQEMCEVKEELKEIRQIVNQHTNDLQTFRYDIDYLTEEQAFLRRDLNRINKRLNSIVHDRNGQ